MSVLEGIPKWFTKTPVYQQMVDQQAKTVLSERAQAGADLKALDEEEKKTMAALEAKVISTREQAETAVRKANELTQAASHAFASANGTAASFRARRAQLERVLMDSEPEECKRFRQWIEKELVEVPKQRATAQGWRWSNFEGRHVELLASNSNEVKARLEGLYAARRELEQLSRQYLEPMALKKKLGSMTAAIPRVQAPEAPK